MTIAIDIARAGGRPALETEVLAVQQKDLLRHLAAHPGAGVPAICGALAGRDPSNLRKTLSRLASAGLVGADHVLTGAGMAWLPRLAAVDGAPLADGQPLLTWAQIRADPNNPRTVPVGDERTTALMDNIARRGLKQALLVRLDADGQGAVLNDGWRRWSAIGALIARGDPRWSADKPVPYLVNAATDEAEILADAVITSLQKENLHPLDEAAAFVRLQDLGWTPARILEEVGCERRYFEQRRDLQHLTPAQQARMRLDRDDANYLSVKGARGLLQHLRQIAAATAGAGEAEDRAATPALSLTPKLALALAEVAFAIEQRPDRGAVALSGQPRGGAFATLGEQGLVLFIRIGDGCSVVIPKGGRAGAWLTQQGFYDDPKAAVRQAREAVLGGPVAERLAARREYATEELNYTQPARSAPPASVPAPKPALLGDADRPSLETLSGRERIVFFELAHKILADPFLPPPLKVGATRVGSYWLDGRLERLIQELKLIAFMNPGNGAPWVGYVTEAGWDLLGASRQAVTDAELQAVREGGAQAAWPGPGYVTPWLNVAAPATTADAPEDGQAEADDDGAKSNADLDDEEDAEAHELLSDVRATIGRAHTATEIRALFERTGLKRPFALIDDEAGVVWDQLHTEAAVADTSGELHDLMATARGELIAYALNLATGPQGDARLRAPIDRAPINRLAGAAEAIRQLLLNDVDPGSSLFGKVEQVYAGFDAALAATHEAIAAAPAGPAEAASQCPLFALHVGDIVSIGGEATGYRLEALERDGGLSGPAFMSQAVRLLNGKTVGKPRTVTLHAIQRVVGRAEPST